MPFQMDFFMLAEITSENIREKIKESFNCVTKLCIEISKGLFGILGFFQKTNEQIRF